MASHNEWDPLKKVIVGTADTSSIPYPNISTMKCQFPEYDEAYVLDMCGRFPKQLIEEQNEDLDQLADTLKDLGVEVFRPTTEFSMTHTESPTWNGMNWHYHCPRDLTLIVGDTIIETPSPIWNRQFETWGYQHIFQQMWDEGYNWIKAPIPKLLSANYKDDTRGVASLNNYEILFEAANCVRVNNEILYQVSNTGNRIGGEWLQRVLGEHYTVHIADDLYSFAHLDSTIVPIREGLVLYNASRVTPENEPEIFKSWDKIWIDECVSSENSPFGLPWGASEWIGCNLLMVNPSLAIVDIKQRQIHEKLKAYGVETIPLELRHDRIISGGFHCVTLDLERSC